MQNTLTEENNRLKEMLNKMHKTVTQQVVDGNPSVDCVVPDGSQDASVTLNRDTEAWPLIDGNFWSSYLSRLTQYTLLLQFGGNLEVIREAYTWSVARMLVWCQSAMEVFRWGPKHGLVPLEVVTIGCHVHCGSIDSENITK